ncbi:MAG: caspase family protein [Gammaproteobacteria bacterium]|nr:caspase family protein [Gammaproteobacteria bacterium]
MRDVRFLLKTHYTNSRALIIGIDKYAKASPLSYAVSDASEIRRILAEELGFPAENITYLTDAEATRDRILKAYLRFTAEDIDVDERLLVFFAGHGYTRTGSRGEIGYLVPSDADLSDLATLLRWDDLTRNAELIRAKHILFIMDACYGGLALTRHLQPGSTRFLKDMMLRYSRQVLTAGKADEVVADAGGPIPKHSVFTGHLIEGLRGNAATAEGVITAGGLMAYVYGKVANDKNSNQTPHYGYFDGDGDFIIRAPNLTELETPENKDIDRLIAVPYPDEHPQPETTDAKVRRVKALLATDSASIELHDFLIGEVRQFLAATSEDGFRAEGQFSQAEFLRRLARYEEVSTDIAVLLACVTHWAKPAHKATLQKALARSADRLEQQGGLTVWLALRWYPLLLELYCSGIAAVDAQRFDSLATVFYTPIPTSEYQARTETFVDSTAGGLLELHRSNVLKQIPGHEKNYVPLSEYLFKILQPKLDDVLFLGKNYEQAFDTFEVFYALAVADLDLLKGHNGWGPVGRFGWKHRSRDNGPLARVVAQGRAQQAGWAPLQAGLFGGSYERFDAVATTYTERISKLGWW